MQALMELRRMLETGKSLTGTVVSISGGSLVAGTSRGPMALDIPTGMTLLVGDLVRVESKTITGKLPALSQIPVYDL
jgi:hypothetical protein